MEDDASDSRAVWKLATIALGMIALGVCAYSFVLYSDFCTELAAARNDADLAHREIVTLKAQLSAMEAQSAADQEILRSTHAAPLAAAAPSQRELPIELSFHDAVSRSGKVAVLHNLADADLEIVLEVESPASGEHIRRPLVINGHGMLQIGAAQGWQFSPGQIVTLNNDNYRPVVRVVS
jgi:hypothetical protein